MDTADIFRPSRLTFPKNTYRLKLTDEQEVNMNVIRRNKKFGYFEVEMVDDPQLSGIKVYMTQKQVFQHCNFYMDENKAEKPTIFHKDANDQIECEKDNHQKETNDTNHIVQQDKQNEEMNIWLSLCLSAFKIY